MVHVSTPRPSLGSALGNAIGGVGGQIAGQEYGRYQTRQGLDKLRKSSQNASPIDQLYNLIEASDYSPQIGKAIGPLYQTLMSQQGANQLGSGLTGSQPQSQNGTSPVSQNNNVMPSNDPIPMQSGSISNQGNQTLPMSKSSAEVEKLSDEYLNQVRPDLISEGSNFGRVPTFDFAQKSSLTPEEEGQIRQNLNKDKVLPAVQDQIIERMQNSIANRYKEALQNYNITSEQQQAMNQKWNTIKQDAQTQLAPFISSFPPKTKDFLQNRYFKYAASSPTNLTPEAVEGQAMGKLQQDIDRLNSLAEAPTMPPVRQWGDVKSSLENIKSLYKPLKEAGFAEALKEDAIYNKDMGIEEMHEAIWGDQTNRKVLNQIAEVKKGKDEGKYIDQLANRFKNLGPNDDLVLAKSMVLDGGGTIEDYRKALDKAKEEGLELSPFQEGQYQESMLPRQRPLYEIFSNPSPIGAIGGAAGIVFKHFLNYVRGKK
jgi:hypothetical protein